MKKHDKSQLINYFTEDNKSGYKTRENHILKTFPFLIKEINKYHRFNFRKDVLVKEGYDKEKTEFQIMNERGFFRIYDCGNLKFELII